MGEWIIDKAERLDDGSLRLAAASPTREGYSKTVAVRIPPEQLAEILVGVQAGPLGTGYWPPSKDLVDGDRVLHNGEVVEVREVGRYEPVPPREGDPPGTRVFRRKEIEPQ